MAVEGEERKRAHYIAKKGFNFPEIAKEAAVEMGEILKYFFFF